jgi:hypothetical protein
MNDSIRIYAVSSLSKYMIDDLNIDGDSSVSLTCAKGEIRSFQVIVANQGEIDNSPPINLSIYSIEESIPSFILYREHYVETKKSTRFKNYRVGFYPDALIPFLNPHTGKPISDSKINPSNLLSAYDYNIPPGENVGYWVDVNTFGVDSGDYTNKIIVDIGGEITEININIKVVNVDLSSNSDLSSMIIEPKESILPFYNIDNINSPEWLILSDNFRKTCADNQIFSFLTMTPSTAYGSYENSWGDNKINEYREITEKYNVNTFRFLKWYISDNKTATEEQKVIYLQNIERLVNENSWITNPVFTYDEPNTAEQYAEVIYISNLVRGYCPSVRFLVTEQVGPPNPDGYPNGLKGYVDIWGPLVDILKVSDIQERISLGEEGWSYTALTPQILPDNGKCNWQIDGPIINYLAFPWISYNIGLKGILYWGGACYWKGNEGDPVNPWYNPESYVLGDNVYNGEGYLVYPSTDVGYEYDIITSIRMKVLREGVQDYKRFKAFESLAGESETRRLVSQAAVSYDNFNSEKTEYERLRKKILLMTLDNSEDRKYIEDVDYSVTIDTQKTINKYRMVPEERSSTIIDINNNKFVVDGSNGSFIWDYEECEEHVFNYDGEYIIILVNNETFKITYKGDFLFDIELLYKEEFFDVIKKYIEVIFCEKIKNRV